MPTYQEICRMKKAIMKDLGLSENEVNLKHAEIALRIKASHGRLTLKEINDIVLGKIK